MLSLLMLKFEIPRHAVEPSSPILPDQIPFFVHFPILSFPIASAAGKCKIRK
jgi:hypothetical protein